MPASAFPASSTATPIEIWPEGRMPLQGVTKTETCEPSSDGDLHLSHVSRPTLTLFPASGNSRPAPTMIVCPGGGYDILAIEKEGTLVASWLASLGITALVLKYRVPDNRAGALQDLQRALRLTRAQSAAWNIDPARLGAMGFSAGGHLCARASTLFDQPAYNALDTIDAQSCRPDFVVLVYPAYLDALEGGLSPELNMQAVIPPTLIVHNEDDFKYVQGSTLYSAALNKVHAPHDFLYYKTGGHGYGLNGSGDIGAWPEDAAAWLRGRILAES